MDVKAEEAKKIVAEAANAFTRNTTREGVPGR